GICGQGLGVAVPAETPWQSLSRSECERFRIGRNHRAVGKVADLVLLQRWHLAGDGVSLAMQQTIDLRRGRPGKTVATHEAVLKTACSLASAIEAGAVPRGQRRHLVQKEKFGPTGTARGAVSAHRLPPRS